jgi:DNA-binding NtrC family response regulator
MACILVIEIQRRIQSFLQYGLATSAKVKAIASFAEALSKVAKHSFDLVVWDSCDDPAGQPSRLQESLKDLAVAVPNAKVIVLTPGDESLSPRVRFEKISLIREPVGKREIVSLIEQSLPATPTGNENLIAQTSNNVPIEFEGLIAIGLPMRAMVQRAIEAAAVDVPVLITGETGTGKDLIASAIHKRSRRKDKPYVAVNTGAMAPELIASEIFGHEKGAYTGAQDARPGIFEQAHGGTVFLDEIATMDAKTQISLLRVLEEKSFRRVGGIKNITADVRIIAAANEDLEKNVAEKRFREDLFYRLNVFHIAIPPLRERPGAVTVLTDHFVAEFAAFYDKPVECVTLDAYRMLRHYAWPGNVRELKNVIQTAVVMADGKELTPEVLPPRIRDGRLCGNGRADLYYSFPVGVTLGAVEKEVIQMTLASVKGNKKQAASVLGISRRALYNKMTRHELS